MLGLRPLCFGGTCMGTRKGAGEARTDRADSKTTATMRWVIAGVAVVVAAGIGWAVWTTTLGDQIAAAPPAVAENTSAAPSSGASPGATPVHGSEVIAPEPRQSDPARLPALAQPTPRVVAPLPADAAEQGGLVEGFPTPIVEPTAESDVIDSSVSSDGSTMQAALNARTDQSPAAIADHYREMWTELGLAPVTAEGDGLAYADRFTSITLAVRESGTGTVYTLYATLRTE